jgi:hypothetical protein
MVGPHAGYECSLCALFELLCIFLIRAEAVVTLSIVPCCEGYGKQS